MHAGDMPLDCDNAGALHGELDKSDGGMVAVHEVVRLYLSTCEE